MPFCTQCGFQNDHDARYCNGCGQELSDFQVSPPTAKNQLKAGRVVFFLAIFLLLATIVTGLHLANVTLWPDVDSDRQENLPGDVGSVAVPPVEKPRDIRREISKIQKVASGTADKVFGSDQELGPMAEPPAPLAKGLRDVEMARSYHYIHQDCNHLFSDVGQQAANSIEAELVRVTAISPEEESRFGRRFHEQIKKDNRGKMDVDSGWVEYVRTLGKSLAARTARKGIDYHFHVIHKAEGNAFAMPGGGIYIYTGLLDKIENEAQLAYVLAHEIKHVDLRHCIAMYQILSNLPGVLQSPAAFISQFARHPYSARREAEADRRALELTYGFGYSPYQTVNYWDEKIPKGGDPSQPKQERGLLGNVMDTVTDEMKNVLNTHPKYQKRCCLLKNHIIKLQKAYPMGRLYVGKWNFESKVPMFVEKM